MAYLSSYAFKLGENKMARLKNRRIYGIQKGGLGNSLYVNFGESRYAYISHKDFVENVRTWKFNFSNTNTNAWLPILSNMDKLPRSFYFDPITLELLELMKSFNYQKIEDKVIHFKNGQYLIEFDKFEKLHNGSIKNKNIKTYKKHTIKFDLNGTCGFSIWRGKTSSEDRIWSISAAEKAIDEMCEGKKFTSK
jgi:hypothetical protein